MKVYQTSEIRNITLAGNAGSGKTTFAEAMLLNSGLISRMGEVSSKTTVSDYHEVEHEQGGSVYSTLLYAEWKKNKINVLDNPGADDFIAGLASSLSVADSMLLFLNAQNAVEVGAEVAWRYSDRFNKPTMFVINHLDHDKSNFEKTIEEVRQKFSKKAVIVQYPVNIGIDFDAVIDLLKMKMLKWKKEGGIATLVDIPAGELEKAEELQNELIEAAAENDESLMEIFFEKETLTEDEMRAGIQTGLINREMFPIFCASARSNMGVTRLMDFITNVLPAPNLLAAPVNSEGEEVVCKSDAPTSLFVFKNSVEPHLGEVLMFRVASGTIKESDDLINTNRQSKERLSQLYVVAGNKREKVPELHAGDIAATVKLKSTKAEHTLAAKEISWTFPPIPFPEPRYRVAFKALNESDDEKLGEALHRIHDEDPTVILEYSKELKQLIVHGRGEHHLNTVKWMLSKLFKIEIEFVAPKIPYRETITKVARSYYRHKKQSGGSGQFGEVHLVIEPYKEGMKDPSTYRINGGELTVNVRGKEEHDLPWGGKLVFYNCIVGGVIDTRFLPAIMKGLMEKMEEGPLTGSYARDICVSVFDGKMHPVDSNEISFKIAGAKAFSDAFKNAGPKIMEPVYDVEVLVPSDRMGDVMSDLQGRRAMIQGMSSEKGFEKIEARVPLAEMGKYSTVLSSITSGRAMFSMKFVEYAPVPGDLQGDLLKAYAAEQDDD